MSLLGSLNLGASALAAQQVGLQVTGNNIANAGTDGYNRQKVGLSPNESQQIGRGLAVGTGVSVTDISRQVNFALNTSLRDATSDQNQATTLDNFLSRVQGTFGTLNSNDLSSQLGNFFNSFSTLAQNPQDSAQRSVVIQNGVSLAGYLQNLRSNLVAIRTDADAQVQQLSTQANSLLGTIADLNKQITQSLGSGNMPNALLDQRDAALSSLSKIMNIKVIDQGNGMVNVYSGTSPLVEGTTSDGFAIVRTADVSGKFAVTKVASADTGNPITPTSGTLAALIQARDTDVGGAISTLDQLANGLISTVNGVHSQGQGVTAFADTTGTTSITDPTAALNAQPNSTGLPNMPVNGTFDLFMHDSSTGLITTQQIKVNLTGVGPQTTLNSLAASLTSGNIVASVDSNGRLNVSSNNSNVTFSFGQDTSGTLSALGINTFFTGTDANSIAVNQAIQDNPDLLATGRGNTPGSNANATALALGYTAGNSQFNGQSLRDYYTNFIGSLATTAHAASNDVQAQNTIHDTLYSQVQAYSGVNMNEEAVNLMTYQQAFAGAARFINTVNQTMQQILAMVQ